MRLYLHKNDLTKNDKLPYFSLKIVPEEGVEGAEWKTIGAFWKAASGKGYTGKLEEGVVIDTAQMKVWEKPATGDVNAELQTEAQHAYDGGD